MDVALWERESRRQRGKAGVGGRYEKGCVHGIRAEISERRRIPGTAK